MQDSNETSWAGEREHESSPDTDAAELTSGTNRTDESQQDGWQQYRRWISRAPAPRGGRTGVDPSVYTWKGYRSWAEQVKRNWSDS